MDGDPDFCGGSRKNQVEGGDFQPLAGGDRQMEGVGASQS